MADKRSSHADRFPPAVGPGGPTGAKSGRTDTTRRASVVPITALEQLERILAAQKAVLHLLATGKPLEEILAALVRSIEEGCDGTLGSVLLLDDDGKTLRHGAAPALPEAYNRAIDGVQIGPQVGSCGTAAYRGEPVVVENIATDPLWVDFRDLATQHGLGACWSQPIFSSGRKVLGTFAMYYTEPRGPRRADREYIETAAELAGIAIERARVEAERLAAERRLMSQTAVLVELAKSEQLSKCDYKAFLRTATEAAAGTLSVERVGIWFFSGARSTLRCSDLYQLSFDSHSSGTELQADRYPRYFAALERGRTVAAHDACRDRATSEFADSYLRPLGITSMLDAPIRRAGELVGVVCHEHVGHARNWAPDEQEFAASIADFIALALEAAERRRAELSFRAAQEELLRQQWHARRQVESELERVKDQLVRSTRLATIGQVAASIAHELRNPLGAIHNAEYYLKRRVPQNEPKWTEYLEIIEQEMHAADSIVGNLLEMSRAREPIKQAVELGEAAREAFGRARDAEHVTLRLDLDPDPFTIDADPDQLRQMLVNLFTNAAQALPGPGTVTVAGRCGELLNVITVRDDGPGIPRELHERIFEPLFTTKIKGTGLGLTICLQIAERHGWTLEIMDTEGQGAAFRFQLPAKSPV